VDFVRLNSHDVVRHKLVGRIVAAYDKYDADREAAAPPSGPRRSGA
jgi:phosphate starvation-inducible PhoH-like protein